MGSESCGMDRRGDGNAFEQAQENARDVATGECASGDAGERGVKREGGDGSSHSRVNEHPVD